MESWLYRTVLIPRRSWTAKAVSDPHTTAQNASHLDASKVCLEWKLYAILVQVPLKLSVVRCDLLSWNVVDGRLHRYPGQ
jgi:hypothetical protein